MQPGLLSSVPGKTLNCPAALFMGSRLSPKLLIDFHEEPLTLSIKKLDASFRKAGQDPGDKELLDVSFGAD